MNFMKINNFELGHESVLNNVIIKGPSDHRQIGKIFSKFLDAFLNIFQNSKLAILNAIFELE